MAIKHILIDLDGTLTDPKVGIHTSIRYAMDKLGEFKHEVRQFEKSYDNQQAEQISLMV